MGWEAPEERVIQTTTFVFYKGPVRQESDWPFGFYLKNRKYATFQATIYESAISVTHNVGVDRR